MTALVETGQSGTLARINLSVTSALPPIAAVGVISVKRSACDPKRTLVSTVTTLKSTYYERRLQ
jgi:hypothetical protein